MQELSFLIGSLVPVPAQQLHCLAQVFLRHDAIGLFRGVVVAAAGHVFRKLPGLGDLVVGAQRGFSNFAAGRSITPAPAL